MITRLRVKLANIWLTIREVTSSRLGLVISFASGIWVRIRTRFSNDPAVFISVCSLLVSLGSFTIAGLSMYFTTFWAPVDLIAYFNFPHPNEIGTNKLIINYIFVNSGKQSALIESVGVIQLNRRPISYKPGEYYPLKLCEIENYTKVFTLHDVRPDMFPMEGGSANMGK
jgi:hypothetical protein